MSSVGRGNDAAVVAGFYEFLCRIVSKASKLVSRLALSSSAICRRSRAEFYEEEGGILRIQRGDVSSCTGQRSALGGSKCFLDANVVTAGYKTHGYEPGTRMYSEDRYREIEEQFRSSARDFDGDHPNDEMARTLLITTQELARIHRTVKQEYGEEPSERHQYQDVFFTRGLHGLYSLHRLIKRYRYDAAHREVRFLLETYFCVRGLNRDKEEAAAIYSEYREEVEELGLDADAREVALHEFDAVDDLFDVWRDERSRAKEVWPEVRQYYNYVSNRSTHPVRMYGAWDDGSWSEGLEEELLTWGLYLSYGLCKELLKTYNDTSAGPFIKRESQPIVARFDEVLGKDVPTFLLETY